MAAGAGVPFASTRPSSPKRCSPLLVLRVCESTMVLLHATGGIQRTVSEAQYFWSSTPSPDEPEQEETYTWLRSMRNPHGLTV